MRSMRMNSRLFRRIIATAALFQVTSLCAQWVNVTGNLAGMPSECGNLSFMSVIPGKDRVIAGVAKHGLWQTVDGGETWTPLGQTAGSDAIVNRPSQIQPLRITR